MLSLFLRYMFVFNTLLLYSLYTMHNLKWNPAITIITGIPIAVLLLILMRKDEGA